MPIYKVEAFTKFNGRLGRSPKWSETLGASSPEDALQLVCEMNGETLAPDSVFATEGLSAGLTESDLSLVISTKQPAEPEQSDPNQKQMEGDGDLH